MTPTIEDLSRRVEMLEQQAADADDFEVLCRRVSYLERRAGGPDGRRADPSDLATARSLLAEAVARMPAPSHHADGCGCPGCDLKGRIAAFLGGEATPEPEPIADTPAAAPPGWRRDAEGRLVCGDTVVRQSVAFECMYCVVRAHSVLRDDRGEKRYFRSELEAVEVAARLMEARR